MDHVNGLIKYLNVINLPHVNQSNLKLIKNANKYHLSVQLMEYIVYLLQYVMKQIQMEVVLLELMVIVLKLSLY